MVSWWGQCVMFSPCLSWSWSWAVRTPVEGSSVLNPFVLGGSPGGRPTRRVLVAVLGSVLGIE